MTKQQKELNRIYLKKLGIYFYLVSIFFVLAIAMLIYAAILVGEKREELSIKCICVSAMLLLSVATISQHYREKAIEEYFKKNK